MIEELLFCPLGGSGEIGMNINLFAYYDASLSSYINKYLSNTAPAEVLFYFYPREQYNESSQFLSIFQ